MPRGIGEAFLAGAKNPEDPKRVEAYVKRIINNFRSVAERPQFKAECQKLVDAAFSDLLAAKGEACQPRPLPTPAPESARK